MIELLHTYFDKQLCTCSVLRRLVAYAVASRCYLYQLLHNDVVASRYGEHRVSRGVMLRELITLSHYIRRSGIGGRTGNHIFHKRYVSYAPPLYRRGCLNTD